MQIHNIGYRRGRQRFRQNFKNKYTNRLEDLSEMDNFVEKCCIY